MPNAITLAKNYTDIIDEVYAIEAKSSVLNSDASLMRAGSNAKEVMIPKVSVTGLGNYDRAKGYKTGSVTFEWETKKFEYDRGTKIVVDAMDAQEVGASDAFVAANAELERTQVAPEGDAYTFAKIAGTPGISKVSQGVTYATGAEVLKAIDEAQAAMDEASVPAETRYLFITPTLARKARAVPEANTEISKDVLDGFAGVVEVPQSRFYTAVKLNDGESEFGFAKDGEGKDINFLIVEKSAVIKFDKHVAGPKVFGPDELEDLDAFMTKYRKYGIVDVFDNKKAGVFLSHKA